MKNLTSVVCPGGTLVSTWNVSECLYAWDFEYPLIKEYPSDNSNVVITLTNRVPASNCAPTVTSRLKPCSVLQLSSKPVVSFTQCHGESELPKVLSQECVYVFLCQKY